MRLSRVAVVVALALNGAPLFAQTADVVSLKPHAAGGRHDASVYRADPAIIQYTAVSLKDLICTAYVADPWTCDWAVQFTGMKWIENDRYDLEAHWGQPLNSDEEIRQHLQRALEDRFKLVVKRETRPIPVFRLEPAPKGAKLTPATDTRRCGQAQFAAGVIAASCLTMDDLADAIEGALEERHIVNATGLPKGQGYQIHLEFGDGENAESGPSIFTALPEQLGLKLVPGTAPSLVYVIAKAQRPEGN